MKISNLKLCINSLFFDNPSLVVTVTYEPSSLRHVILGFGWPLALQYSNASSPSFTVTSLDDVSSVISGGTEIENVFLKRKKIGLDKIIHVVLLLSYSCNVINKFIFIRGKREINKLYILGHTHTQELIHLHKSHSLKIDFKYKIQIVIHVMVISNEDMSKHYIMMLFLVGLF